MEKKILMDEWVEVGYTMDSFERDIKKISDATDVLSVKPQEMKFLSLCKIPEYQKEGKLVFYVLTKEYTDDFILFGEKLRLCALDKTVLGEELVEELTENTGLMALVDDEKYIISRSSLQTLCQRACISGDTTVNRSNIARDIHLVDGLFARNERINFVYRKADGINKIFACFSSDFVLHKQADLVLRALKHEDFPFEYELEKYQIDNFYTDVELKISENEYIVIRNSDVGLSSLVVRVVYRYEDTSIIYSEHLLRHDRTMSFEKFLYQTIDEAFKSLKASSYNEEIQALKLKPIMDYSEFNEFNPFQLYENKANMEELLLNLLFACFSSVLSKKQMHSLTKMLLENIDYKRHYTFYDVVMQMFRIPNCLKLDQTTIAKCQKELASLPIETLKELPALF